MTTPPPADQREREIEEYKGFVNGIRSAALSAAEYNVSGVVSAGVIGRLLSVLDERLAAIPMPAALPERLSEADIAALKNIDDVYQTPKFLDAVSSVKRCARCNGNGFEPLAARPAACEADLFVEVNKAIECCRPFLQINWGNNRMGTVDAQSAIQKLADFAARLTAAARPNADDDELLLNVSSEEMCEAIDGAAERLAEIAKGTCLEDAANKVLEERVALRSTAPATATNISDPEELRRRYLNDAVFHRFVDAKVADGVFERMYERVPGHVSQNEGDGWQLRPKFRPNESATATVREAADGLAKTIEAALRIVDLWMPDEAGYEEDNFHEFHALDLMRTGFAAAVEKNNRRVVFEFDERSNDTIEELKSRGMRFVEIALCNPETGERRSLLLPAAVDGAEPT